MKNYSEMSDFEINYSVAEKVLTFDELVAVPMFGGAVRWSEGDRDGWNHFNPCNSWADAGPIIEKNLIDLEAIYKFTDESEEHIAPIGVWAARAVVEGDSFPRCEDVSPLRAAMIVFLMMQESK